MALDLDLGPQGNGAPRTIATLLKRRGTAPGTSNIRFGLDPIGTAVLAGGGARAWRTVARDFSRTIADLADRGFRGPFAAAMRGLCTMPAAPRRKSSPTRLRSRLRICARWKRRDCARCRSPHDLFPPCGRCGPIATTAKFRALRKLWGRIEEACGLAPATAFVAAETAWRMMTKRDPYVNMLRTHDCGRLGGAGRCRRHYGAAVHPGAGAARPFRPPHCAQHPARAAGKIEPGKGCRPGGRLGRHGTLTEQLCRAAWTGFQQTEKAGGAWASLQRGELQQHVAAVRAKRRTAVAMRKMDSPARAILRI